MRRRKATARDNFNNSTSSSCEDDDDDQQGAEQRSMVGGPTSGGGVVAGATHGVVVGARSVRNQNKMMINNSSTNTTSNSTSTAKTQDEAPSAQSRILVASDDEGNQRGALMRIPSDSTSTTEAQAQPSVKIPTMGESPSRVQPQQPSLAAAIQQQQQGDRKEQGAKAIFSSDDLMFSAPDRRSTPQGQQGHLHGGELFAFDAVSILTPQATTLSTTPMSGGDGVHDSSTAVARRVFPTTAAQGPNTTKIYGNALDLNKNDNSEEEDEEDEFSRPLAVASSRRQLNENRVTSAGSGKARRGILAGLASDDTNSTSSGFDFASSLPRPSTTKAEERVPYGGEIEERESNYEADEEEQGHRKEKQTKGIGGEGGDSSDIALLRLSPKAAGSSVFTLNPSAIFSASSPPAIPGARRDYDEIGGNAHSPSSAAPAYVSMPPTRATTAVPTSGHSQEAREAENSMPTSARKQKQIERSAHNSSGNSSVEKVKEIHDTTYAAGPRQPSRLPPPNIAAAIAAITTQQASGGGGTAHQKSEEGRRSGERESKNKNSYRPEGSARSKSEGGDNSDIRLDRVVVVPSSGAMMKRGEANVSSSDTYGTHDAGSSSNTLPPPSSSPYAYNANNNNGNSNNNNNNRNRTKLSRHHHHGMAGGTDTADYTVGGAIDSSFEAMLKEGRPPTTNGTSEDNKRGGGGAIPTAHSRSERSEDGGSLHTKNKTASSSLASSHRSHYPINQEYFRGEPSVVAAAAATNSFTPPMTAEGARRTSSTLQTDATTRRQANQQHDSSRTSSVNGAGGGTKGGDALTPIPPPPQRTTAAIATLSKLHDIAMRKASGEDDDEDDDAEEYRRRHRIAAVSGAGRRGSQPFTKEESRPVSSSNVGGGGKNKYQTSHHPDRSPSPSSSAMARHHRHHHGSSADGKDKNKGGDYIDTADGRRRSSSNPMSASSGHRRGSSANTVRSSIKSIKSFYSSIASGLHQRLSKLTALDSEKPQFESVMFAIDRETLESLRGQTPRKDKDNNNKKAKRGDAKEKKRRTSSSSEKEGDERQREGRKGKGSSSAKYIYNDDDGAKRGGKRVLYSIIRYSTVL